MGFKNSFGPRNIAANNLNFYTTQGMGKHPVSPYMVFMGDKRWNSFRFEASFSEMCI